MSEPESKLDLTALQDALDDATPATSAAAAEEKAAAPYKLPDEPAAPATSASTASTASTTKAATTASTPAAAAPVPATANKPVAAATPTAPETTGDPNVDAIRAMFPTFDAETVREVLSHNGGDMEGAVNSLLSMTDPTYVAPPRAPASSTLESDALLAASLAAEDRQQRNSRPASAAPQQPARPFFEGTGATYDASQLNYAPRVRRNPPSAAARAAYTAPPPPGLESITPDKPVVEGWPGEKDAKRWMDQIDKAAETGLSKAASTFSALRQRVAQASSPDGTASPSGSSGTATPSSRGGGGAASFFAPLVSSVRQATGAVSGSGASSNNPPSRSSSASGYDRDPAPVGNAELAALLARGSAPPSKADRILGTRANAGAFEDRYGASSNAARAPTKAGTASAAANKAQPAAPSADEEEEELGWGDVGRAPAPKANAKNKISINDNSNKALPGTGAATTTPGDSVNKMDAAAGRGLTSPTSASAAKGAAFGAAAGAGAGVGAATALGSQTHIDDDDDDEEGGSDLEYVSNPFENDD